MSTPFFTVVVASRNRPELMKLAVDSVMQQSFTDLELILVNDGSDEQYMPALEAVCREYAGRMRRIDLVRYPRGHGQSYSLNTGAFAGTGEFVTFLDDDDFWTDMDYLQKVHDALTANPGYDVHYANQLAVEAGKTPDQGQVLWLADLESVCQRAGLTQSGGVYKPEVNQLMQANGFAHLNCSVVRRSVFVELKGMDEDIRWECDREIYLRTVDHVGKVLFNPAVVSQHHVPDKTKATNMTTAISVYQRLNYQIYVLNKIALLAKTPEIVRHARQHKVYALRKVAESFAQESRWDDALYFSSQALFADRSWKWPIKHLGIWLRALTA